LARPRPSHRVLEGVQGGPFNHRPPLRRKVSKIKGLIRTPALVRDVKPNHPQSSHWRRRRESVGASGMVLEVLKDNLCQKKSSVMNAVSRLADKYDVWVRISSPARSVRRFLNRFRADPVSAWHHWVREPVSLADAELCIFVCYARYNVVPAHALFHARAWAAAGFRVVLVLALDEPDVFCVGDDLSFAAGILLRQNAGYDFAAWATAIRVLAQLREARIVAIANDSVYGPFDGFPELIARARRSQADVIGLTESYELCRHFQSYALFFKHRALASVAFTRFWQSVRIGSRRHVIDNYELLLLTRMEEAGLACETLFSGPEDGRNPTLTIWRELLEQGFPFIKVQLLRDNPAEVDLSEWRQAIENHDFQLRLIEDQLAQNKRYV
jgi:hypothetical protein